MAVIAKIISGGQTGADRAALDFAIEYGIPHGGWIPKGRLAEDGPLPEKYLLREIDTPSYPERTEKNVLDSDGTLIITIGELTGGSLLTKRLAESHGRPCLHIDLSIDNKSDAAKTIQSWIKQNKVSVLNVAGPRQSQSPAIYNAVFDLLVKICGDIF